ncbi:MAG: universal stress protein [Deltaproteobacteria bacterium]|nr:universal stress protein [Deltaproteobacteria bacterium]
MKIIVGYDGSDVCRRALLLAKDHAKAFDGKVYVLTSLVGGPQEKLEDIQKAEAGLEYAETLLKRENVPCEVHLLIRGLTPGEDLVEFANENQAGEIIVGIERKSKVGKFIFGSNAQYVIIEAKCPVMTIK